MSWEDQGRQCHMWFGHGTAGNKATKAAPGSSVVGQSTADRVLALAYGALASLAAAHRGQAEAQYHNGTLPRLKDAMTAWYRAQPGGLRRPVLRAQRRRPRCPEPAQRSPPRRDGDQP